MTDSIKSLILAIRDKCPGQKECDNAIDCLNENINHLDQAILSAMSQQLKPHASSTLQVGGVCMCVCACMYVCMHLCMYVCMHASMYVCVYVCMHASMYVCMYVCMHASMYVCMYVCMHLCMYL